MLQNNSNVSADNASKLMHDKASLSKVNRFFNVASIIYAGICLVYAGATLFMIVLTVSCSFWDTFILFFDGILAKAGVLFFGYLSCYKHNNKVVLLPIAIQIFDIAIITLNNLDATFDSLFGVLGIDLNTLLLFVFAILGILIYLFNKKYQYLEKQEGFPYFNERVEEEEMKRQQFEEANPFVLRKKQLEINSSHDMERLDYSQRSGDNGKDDLRGKGSMDEI